MQELVHSNLAVGAGWLSSHNLFNGHTAYNLQLPQVRGLHMHEPQTCMPTSNIFYLKRRLNQEAVGQIRQQWNGTTLATMKTSLFLQTKHKTKTKKKKPKQLNSLFS